MTVTPTEYVYTGGRQPGAIIGLIAYARFVKSNAELDSMAKDLAYDRSEEHTLNSSHRT